MRWCDEDTVPTTVVRRSQYEHKNVFVIFFRSTGPEFIHTIETGNTISGDFHKNYCLKCLFDNIKRKRPSSGLRGLKLHHNNARSHQTNDVKASLQEQGMMLMRQPPHSLPQAVTKELRAIPKDDFRKTFQKWIERMKFCITNQGEYFTHLME